MAKRVKNVFQETKKIIYSGTNSKDLHTKSTNSSQDKYIKFCIRCIFSSEASRWMAPSSILQLQDNTARTEL